MAIIIACLKGTLSGRPFFILALWFMFLGPVEAAPVIEELQAFDFGRLAIASNTSVSRYSVPRTGQSGTIEGQIVKISNPSLGRYQFKGFPANTTLTISLTPADLTANGLGGPEPLAVDNYDFSPLVTDANGDAELVLGGRISTSGNGNQYFDAVYSGSTTLRVDYWQPDVSDYVFNVKVISLGAELNSSLAMNEVQQLDFGTIFASSHNLGQAVLTLSPSGSYAVSEPGGSRLVSITQPKPGIVRISGAAANYSLTITPQVGDVLLQHTISPGAAPHFILGNLTTSPDGAGATDANGELLIKIGGSLKTELTASPEVYPSGTYEGTYDLTVNY